MGASAINVGAQNQTNATNARIARSNRLFQERMARNAMQYRVEDLKKAGLNPILAAGGPGAATPPGSTAQMVAPKVDDPLSAGVSTALEARRLKKELSHVESQVALNKAQENTQKAQEMLTTTNAKVAKAQLPLTMDQAKLERKRVAEEEKFVGVDAYMRRINAGLGIMSNATRLTLPKFGKPPAESRDKLLNRQWKERRRKGMHRVP
jgi:hypothetical protein